MRLPDVTAKVSGDENVLRPLLGICGKEMWVIGFEFGDGTRACDLKDFQYRWSAVIGAGPSAALMTGSGCTMVAILVCGGGSQQV